MKDEIRKNFYDIIQAAEEIKGFTDSMEFAAYQSSAVTQRAVERDFEIIGEALNRIRRIDEDALETISEHHRIIGFRNVLIHGYDTVDEAVVWNAVVNHLPKLIQEVRQLMDE